MTMLNSHLVLHFSVVVMPYILNIFLHYFSPTSPSPGLPPRTTRYLQPTSLALAPPPSLSPPTPSAVWSNVANPGQKAANFSRWIIYQLTQEDETWENLSNTHDFRVFFNIDHSQSGLNHKNGEPIMPSHVDKYGGFQTCKSDPMGGILRMIRFSIRKY